MDRARCRATSVRLGQLSCEQPVQLSRQGIVMREHQGTEGHVTANDTSVRRSELRRAPLPNRRDKLWRWLWRVAWLLLYLPTPVPFHAWRIGVLRLFGARIASGSWPYPTARIWAPWNLTMEHRSCLGPGVDCYSAGPIILREGVTVSQRAVLCAAGHDPRDPTFGLKVGTIVIAEGAWVAMEAFIGPGVTVGKDAVVAARAVVVRDVGENVVVAGNPARVVGQRFTPTGDRVPERLHATPSVT